MSDIVSIIRGGPATGAPRDAYEELKNWAIDELTPQMRKIILRKINDLVAKHGIKKRDLLQVLLRPPPGESRPKLVEFLYDTIFS